MSEADIREEKERVSDFLRDGKLREALAACENILRAAPDDVDTVHRAASILVKQGRSTDGIELFRRAASLYGGLQQPTKAQAVHKLILQLDPSDRGALAALKPTARRPLFVAPVESKTAPLRINGRTLEQFPQLRAMSAAERDALAELLMVTNRRRGETIVVPGGRPESVLFLLRGTVRLERSIVDPTDPFQLDVATAPPARTTVTEPKQRGALLGAVALFGDISLDEALYAETDVTLLELPAQRATELGTTQPALRDALVWAGKDALLEDVIRRSQLLAPFAEMNRDMLVAQAQVRAFPPGLQLLRQGALAGGLYALLQGECRVFERTGEVTEEMPHLHAGDAFGELSLLSNSPVTATVETAGPCIVMGLSRASVLAAVEAYPQVRAKVMQRGVEREARATEWAKATGKIELF